MSLERARRVLAAESAALEAVSARLGTEFESAVGLILETRGRVVLTGMGKSGLVARKIAATLASTGTPALFMHPAEAIHGDLGVLVQGDVVLALSHSGDTNEVIALLETLRRIGAKIVALTGSQDSALGREADLILDTSVAEEGCPLNLAPMASTTAALAIGDALAAAVMEARNFGEEDFARLHPGGKLGRRLAHVSDFMHGGDAMPRVTQDTPMREVVIEMSRKRLGCTTVLDREGHLEGLVTDGDLRRLLESEANPLERSAAECMTAAPISIVPGALATTALKIMEDRKITMLPVVDDDNRALGVIQVHDLWGTNLF